MTRLDGMETVRALRAGLDRKRERLADFGRLHRAAGARLMGWVERNFESRGALLEDQPSGWPGLAPATLGAKRRLGQSDQPLIATGRLRAGFALTADRGRAEVANAVPYARLHQEGEGVPRRALFPQPAQAARIVWPGVLRHVEEALA
jgi:phage gpG-like protein